MDRNQRKSTADCASGLVLLALGVIGVVSGIYHQNSAALAMGVVLLFAPVIVYSILRSALRGVSVTRAAPGSAFEGDSVEIAVRLENGSPWSLFYPRVVDGFTPDLDSRKEILFPDRVVAGETINATYVADCILPRGIYKLDALSVSVSDPFGWFELRKVVKQEWRFKVYPAVQHFGVEDEVGRCVLRILSELVHNGPGDSDEFFAVRDYQHGDPLRRVHWGLTAHRGQPVVREFARHTTGDLHLFIDRNSAALIGIGRGSSMEHCIKIVAALAASSLGRGHRVSVYSGTDVSDILDAGSGREYLQVVLDSLVSIKPDSDLPLASLLDHASPRVLGGSTVVVPLSPCTYHDRDAVERLHYWKRRGIRVIAVCFDAASFRSLWENSPPEESSSRFAERLNAHGIRAIVVPCAADLPAVFESALI